MGQFSMEISCATGSLLSGNQQSHFEEPAPVFRHVEMQDVDLTVEFGDAVLVTRMAAWADTVRKVLA